MLPVYTIPYHGHWCTFTQTSTIPYHRAPAASWYATHRSHPQTKEDYSTIFESGVELKSPHSTAQLDSAPGGISLLAMPRSLKRNHKTKGGGV